MYEINCRSRLSRIEIIRCVASLAPLVNLHVAAGRHDKRVIKIVGIKSRTRAGNERSIAAIFLAPTDRPRGKLLPQLEETYRAQGARFISR